MSINPLNGFGNAIQARTGAGGASIDQKRERQRVEEGGHAATTVRSIHNVVIIQLILANAGRRCVLHCESVGLYAADSLELLFGIGAVGTCTLAATNVHLRCGYTV
ncbi:hypothetical protein EVAR_69297_1 [Eumeta japonica]|uniref:Uncharacterized protein n=1 Tax=Eumeta variegata TaxID=151549 RepID=A0A4C1SFN9_EUMVA|nr:hypothetical protein EVAR_69297_1 [Eumeta japonica]